jgi:hypothetical protein
MREDSFLVNPLKEASSLILTTIADSMNRKLSEEGDGHAFLVTEEQQGREILVEGLSVPMPS